MELILFVISLFVAAPSIVAGGLLTFVTVHSANDEDPTALLWVNVAFAVFGGAVSIFLPPIVGYAMRIVIGVGIFIVTAKMAWHGFIKPAWRESQFRFAWGRQRRK